jgi:hypothetical protein
VSIVIDRPLRLALVALWASGATLAMVTAVVAIRRDAGAVAEYTGAAVALALGALLTARGHRLITTIGLVACAGQPLAVAATAWELSHRISHIQVAKLQALGVNPTVGVAINLVFSLCASLLAASRRRDSRLPFPADDRAATPDDQHLRRREGRTAAQRRLTALRATSETGDADGAMRQRLAASV